MARQALIKDASGALSDLNLLNATGAYLVEAGGGEMSADQVYQENPSLADSALEPIRYDILGSSADNTASIYQDIIKRVRKARQYLSTRWQTAPVYLAFQHSLETNPRYAILKGIQKQGVPDGWDVVYETAGKVEAVATQLVREHPWRGDAPGALPTAETLTKVDGSVDKAEIVVTAQGSIGTGDAPSHLYNYDASLASFSANLIAGNNINLFKAAGETPAAGDILYLGWNTRPGFHVVIPIGTAGVFTADIVVEAYISAAWTALTLGTTYTIHPAASEDTLFQTTGEHVLSFAPGANWQTVAVNGVTAYWVRLRLNTVTSWGTQPITHATETVYGPRKNYIEVPAAATSGDAPPRFMVRVKAPTGGAAPGIGGLSVMVMGAKRTPGTFEAVINLHQYELPAGWTVAMGTDTAEENDLRAPSARRAKTTFATVTAMASRVQLTGASKLADWRGAYQVFLLAEQATGSASTTQVKVRAYLGGTAASDPYVESEKTVALRAVGAGYELVDLGRLSLFTDVVYADNLTADVILQVWAELLSGASNLHFSRLILIPIDQWFNRAWVDSTVAGRHLVSQSMLDADFDVLFDRTVRYRKVGANFVPSGKWGRSAKGRRLEPATQYRIYFVLGHYQTTFGTGPYLLQAGASVVVSFYAVNSYIALRGSA